MLSDYFILTFDQIPSGTAQMKRYDGRSGHFFKSARLQQTENTYLALLSEHAPEKPSECPIALSIEFRYSAKSKKLRGTWKTSRPDVDNVAKLLIDCMTKAGFWKDDSQIVRLTLEKNYSEKELAEIVVTWREVSE